MAINPMTHEPAPSFEEWSDYCVRLGWADFSGTSGDSDEVVRARELQFQSLPAPVLAEYLVRLFENSRLLADRYSADQLGDATWFIFGCGSQYFGKLSAVETPKALQVRCFAAVGRLYLDLFDVLCNRRRAVVDDRCDDLLDTAVYMIWDMGGIEIAIDRPHLLEPGFQILATVLDDCRTSTCVMSALHALGHLVNDYPDRVEPLIASFVERRRAEFPEWLLHYAELAREGRVQ